MYPPSNLFQNQALTIYLKTKKCPIGARCQNGSLDHVCKLLDNCSMVEEDIKQAHYPLICSFVGNDPVVCCSPDTSHGAANISKPPAALKPVKIIRNSYSAAESTQNN